MKGLGAIKDAVERSSLTPFLKIKGGESKVVRILISPEEMISVHEHVEQSNGQWRTFTCIGAEKGCPFCKAGKRASFKTYIPVLDREDGKVKILKAGVKMGAQIIGLIEEYGDITKRDLKLTRTGSGMNNTVYQFFPRDPEDIDLTKYELPDINVLTEEKPVEEMEAFMNGVDYQQNNNNNGGFTSASPNNQGGFSTTASPSNQGGDNPYPF